MPQVRETAPGTGIAAQNERAPLLEPGEIAPTFELPDADLNTVNLESFRGQSHVVLYFYPKDDTPGCTIEAIDFSEREDDFRAYHSIVLGVSMDDCLAHGAFRDKHGLSVQLLADVDGDVCRRYGVVQEREVEGRRKTNIVRSTFIIDSKGVLRHALYGVSPRGHAVEVLQLLKGLGKCR
ncbi:MAG TPA: peroxiredoxin [Burkholderiales bacterium]|nr:peroxiredoxin [Burkholderiales bacterium]